MSWIFFTIFAALMQSIRTAMQKSLGNKVSALSTSWVRFCFGLPIAIIYLLVVFINSNTRIAEINWSLKFFQYSFLAAIMQFIATILLVKILTFRNFAVGTTYVKLEAIFAAIIGILFYGSNLGQIAILGIVVGIIGIIFISIRKNSFSLYQWLTDKSLIYGLSSGVGFALASLWLREASTSLNTGYLLSAALTLNLMIFTQTLVGAIWLFFNHKSGFIEVAKNIKWSFLIGLTSVVGSIGWMTAMTLQDVAKVKTLGQIEIIATISLTFLFFKEEIKKTEWIGIFLILISIFLILF